MDTPDGPRRGVSGTAVLGRRLRAMAVVRAAVTVAVSAFLLTAGADLVVPDHGVLAVPTVIGLLGFSASVPMWPSAAQRGVLDVSLVVDAGAVTVLMALTGGLASPFGSVAVLVVALNLLAFGIRTGIRVAVVTSLGLGWVWATRGPDSGGDILGPIEDVRILVLLLATWVAVAAVALLSRIVEWDLRQAARDGEQIRQVGRSTRPEEGLEAVAGQLARGLVTYLDVASASVWLPHEDGIRLVPAGHHDGRDSRSPDRDGGVRLTAPLVRQARETGQVVFGEAHGPLAELHAGPVALASVSGRRRAEDGLLVVGLGPARSRSHREFLARTLDEVAADAATTLDEARHLAHLRELARTDPVTGLLNHRAMQGRLADELARVERQWQRGRPAGLALALFDLDHFKQVNDRHGHPTGDAVLAAVAEAVDRAARAGDVVCRYGGEEFAILLADTAGEDAPRACERFRRVVAGVQVEAPDGSTVNVTASFGVAAAEGPGVDRATLVEHADVAMYRAKAAGRDRVVSAETIELLPTS